LAVAKSGKRPLRAVLLGDRIVFEAGARRPSGRRHSLYRVGQSLIHGRGVFAGARIPKGTRIVEYVGEIVDEEEAGRRARRRKRVLLLQRKDGAYIDGDPNAPGSCVNHSCQPNCVLKQDGRRVFIVSGKVIEPGEELAYDYKIQADVAYRCFCGAPRCRGTLNRKSRPRKRPKRPGKG
jgi:SET domain-containing protein